MLSGAEMMVKCLQEEGVGLVFGYPGAAICPFYDSLYHSPVRHVLVRREENAAHAASGYSRTTGKIGVCVATSGPGATNLITGIAAAYMDSIPLIAITGQVRLSDLGKDAFQEADVTGACESFVKHSYLVKSAADLPRAFKEAFHIAGTGRPGPVLIDVPQDVQTELVSGFCYPEKAEIIGYKPKTKGHGLQIKKAVRAIEEAQRPLICCGGGVHLAGADEEMQAFSEKTGMPVVSTMMGLGVMDAACPQFLGMLGSYGKSIASRAAHEADLLILCGARVADRAIQSPEAVTAKVIHIDIDPAEIGKNIHADIPIVGDVKQVLQALAAAVASLPSRGWETLLAGYQAPPRGTAGSEHVEPRLFLRELWGILPKDTILAADVGQSQIWAANNFYGKHFLTSGGLGTMGYALPAAIGALLGNPGRTVVALCGDGAFQMSLCELAVVSAENIPLKLILMDNRRLGMVRELQNESFGSRHMATHMGGNPDFVALAGAYGIPAEYAVSNKEALEKASQMMQQKGPYLLVCRVDPETESV